MYDVNTLPLGVRGARRTAHSFDFATCMLAAMGRWRAPYSRAARDGAAGDHSPAPIQDQQKNGTADHANHNDTAAPAPALPPAANGCKKDKDAVNGNWLAADGATVTDPLNPVIGKVAHP